MESLQTSGYGRIENDLVTIFVCSMQAPTPNVVALGIQYGSVITSVTSLKLSGYAAQDAFDFPRDVFVIEGLK